MGEASQQTVRLDDVTMKKTTKTAAKTAKAAPQGDWRVALLARVRALIEDADPDVEEEAKWKKASNPAGVPTWSHGGIICTGESYKNVVKLTFMKGAALKDPARLFNSSLDGNTRRAIDIQEGEQVNATAFQALVRQAVALNGVGPAKAAKKKPAQASKKKASKKKASKKKASKKR